MQGKFENTPHGKCVCVCAIEKYNQKTKSTPNQKAIHKDTRDRKHLYYGISIKPQCNVMHTTGTQLTDAKAKESHLLVQPSREAALNTYVQDKQLVLK